MTTPTDLIERLEAKAQTAMRAAMRTHNPAMGLPPELLARMASAAVSAVLSDPALRALKAAQPGEQI